MAVATQRPGWRTGIALISSALTGSAVSVAITPQSRPWLADRAVDRRVVDRPLLDVPLLQERRVRAVVDELLQRVEDWLGHAVALGDRHAVRSGVVRLPRQLEVPIGLLDDVRRHRGVSHAHLLAAALDREVGGVLVGIDVDADARLPGLLALRVLGR